MGTDRFLINKVVVIQKEEEVLHQVLLLEATWQFRSFSRVPGPGWSDAHAWPGCFLQGAYKRMAVSFLWLHRATGERPKQGIWFPCMSLVIHERPKLGRRVFEPGPNKHNNEQNNNTAITPLIRQCNIDFIKEEGMLHGEYYTTRIMRVLTKYELRGKGKDAVDLPSNFTKISMYERYCYENGWAIKAYNKGWCPSVTEYSKRNINCIIWQDAIDTT
jgi:hypothetical protein